MNRCPKCGYSPLGKQRKPIPKVSKRKPVRVLEDGIRKYPNGREVCKTKAAWQKRREEVWERDERVCHFSNGAQHGICFTYLALCDAHIHHLRKRSLGGRNDAMSNLTTLCEFHHKQVHDEFRKPLAPDQKGA